GNGAGGVGYGLGKASEVPSAIRKGTDQARKNVVNIILKGKTIPHEVIGYYGAGKVLLKPASEGTGVIAGGAVRAVVESAGIRNILTKCIGTKNPHNAVKATVVALRMLQDPEATAKLRREA
ncbi:MAG: 30S ribosomal protein S5, partial [bacterium]|nr:30S ribosomal protein S5 [bacterium]